MAMQLYDVLLVNSLADGLNLVSKEGPVLNRRDGALVLSRRAGAYAELATGALGVDPTDIAGTAETLHNALTMGAPERRARAASLRQAIPGHQLQDWLANLLREMVHEVSSAAL